MLAAYYSIWLCGALLNGGAALRMARNGLIRRYPFVALYLVTCFLRSLILWFAWRDHYLYGEISDATLPFSLLVEAVAIISVFWVMVESYPRFRLYGTAIISLPAAIGLAAVWGTRTAGIPANPLWSEIAMLAQRHASLVMACVVGGIAVALPRVSGIPIRPSASRAVAVFGIDNVKILATTTITLAVSSQASHWPVAARWTITMVPLALRVGVGLLWLLWLTPASNVVGERRLLTDEDRQRVASIRPSLRPYGLR